jgi:hypothetical protein
MDGNPGRLAVDQFAFAGVKAGPNLKVEVVEGLTDRTGAADSPRSVAGASISTR